MTTVFPISSTGSGATTGANGTSSPSSTTGTPDNSFGGQDTFLKLLVAQLKYQNPLAPTDGTEFLSQTAMFTQVETLQKIEKSIEANNTANQTLAASSMVGRHVSYAINTSGAVPRPTPTTIMSLRGALPKDAGVGTHTAVSTSVFNTAGKEIPLQLDFTKTADGWSVQASSNGQDVGTPKKLSFDPSGAVTGGDFTISSNTLDVITGTTGTWPLSGVRIAFGDASDPTRLQLGSGSSTVSVVDQNGNDGQKASGLVTGVHFTSDGPQLVIGGHDIPYASITDVQM